MSNAKGIARLRGWNHANSQKPVAKNNPNVCIGMHGGISEETGGAHSEAPVDPRGSKVGTAGLEV